MIIAGLSPLPMGKQVTTMVVSDQDGNQHHTPFYVVRESTEQEYLNYCSEWGSECLEAGIRSLRIHQGKSVYFYEVYTD